MLADAEKKYRVVNNIGNILMSHELHKNAIAYFSTIIQDYDSISLSKTYALFNRALAYAKLKEYTLAINDIELAMTYAQSLNNTRLYLLAKNRAGLIYTDNQKIEQATIIYKNFLTYYDTTTSENSRLDLYREFARFGTHNLAWINLKLGDTLKALDYYKHSELLCRNNWEYFESYKDYGEILIATGNQQKGRLHLQKALEKSSKPFLLRNIKRLEIFSMLANVSGMAKKVDLLSKGTELLMQYSRDRGELLQLHRQHVVALSLNAHQQAVVATEKQRNLWYGITGLVVFLLLASVVCIWWLVRRNKQLVKDLNHIFDKMTEDTSVL